MALWTFRDFTDESGSNAITEWIATIHPLKKRMKLIAKWDARLDHLRNIEIDDWPTAWFTELSGYPKIFEMKFIIQNMQCRPLGLFWPASARIYISDWRNRKERQICADGSPSTAEIRRNAVEINPEKAVEHD